MKTVKELLFDTHLRELAADRLSLRSGYDLGMCWEAVKRWDTSTLIRFLS